MSIDIVLSALEEYLERKRELCDQTVLESARERAGYVLDEYIQQRFDSAILEERKRSMSPTRKVAIVNPDQIKVTWDEVAKLLDALNSSPVPLKHPKNMSEKDFVRWMEIYEKWYQYKRVKAMALPSAKLEIDLE